MNWLNTSTSTSTDDFQYGYDRDSNVLYKKNLLSSTFSELYHANSAASGDDNSAYDNLNRLQAFTRGTLSSSGNNGSTLDTVTTPNSAVTGTTQSWSLDAVGNQAGVTTDGTSTTNTSNSQNELTGTGGASLTYDHDGNTTTDANGYLLTYDAWNRLSSDSNLSTAHAMVYGYDATGRRISEEDTAVRGEGAVLVVNQGDVQRSMIDSMTLVFDHAVTISSGAITLDGMTYGSITIAVSNPSGDHKTFLITFSGAAVTATGSLSDDIYTLTISHTGVVDYGTTTATLSADATYVVASLLGDADGDGIVTSLDYRAFVAAFDSGIGDPNYNPAMDFNNDGFIDLDDYFIFRSVYLNSAPDYTPGNGLIMIGGSTTATGLTDISSWTANPTRDLYYAGPMQVIEEQEQGVVTAQNVWSLDYVNSLLLRDDNSTPGDLGITGSGLGRRLYAQHDANFNTTALVDPTGVVQQRFIYTPYGQQQALTSSWAVTSDAYSWFYGFQGGRADPSTGLIHFGARDYDPTLGTWIQKDPAGYPNGMEDYEIDLANPERYVDPMGTDIWIEGPSGPEPSGHQSIAIGDPNGRYRSFSFGVDGDCPVSKKGLTGKIYEDMDLGGEISAGTYLKTDAKIDAAMTKAFDDAIAKDKPYAYRLANQNCRSFSQVYWDTIAQRLKDAKKYQNVAPPKRTPAPSSGTGPTTISKPTTTTGDTTSHGGPPTTQPSPTTQPAPTD